MNDTQPPSPADETGAAPASDEPRRYIVGIGASAGGLEALTALISRIPVDLGASYVVVQHLSPTYRSMLVQLLSRETAMQVVEIGDGMAPRPNTLYITPPNRNLVFRGGAFRLVEAAGVVVPKPSVNTFLYSLAEERGEDAIGVILSGTGSDGAGGARAIKAGGGLMFAQDPASAKYTGMPQAAIDTDCVDWVLSCEDIAREITRIVRTQGTVEPVTRAHPPATLKTLLARVQRYTKVDFSEYKENTVWRRILRRMATNRVDTLEDYIALTERNPEELAQLCKEILISVTSFFRDSEGFDALTAALAERLRTKQPGDEIRVWVPGCATGEEVYSIAILIAEMLGRASVDYKIQIFATDIDLSAMAIARKGVYPAASLAEVDSALITRYFVPNGDAYEVVKSLRDMVVFARQDVAQDPPFLRLDAISCRNLLIYFQNSLQERVLATFHYALSGGGLLFLGKSESVYQREDLFEPVAREAKLFRRRGTGVRTPLTAQGSGFVPMPRERVARVEPPKPLELAYLEAVARAYAPPGVLVNERAEVRHVFGDVSPYLTLQPGRVELVLGSLLHRDLRTEVQTLLYQAHQKRQRASGRERGFGGEGRMLRVVVHPVTLDSAGECAIVSFEAIERASPGADAQPDVVAGSARALEDELIATREHLQTVIEELETSNEETQALNEELQASNEELQAANEELQASNEELQSTNEELTTVNEELQIKSAEISAANADLESVQNSFGFAMLVVTQQLRLVRYNESAARYFGISPSAIGEHVRSLFSLHRLEDYAQEVEGVVEDGKPRERQITDGRRHYQMRVTPRVSAQREVLGAVVVLIDDTPLIEAQETLAQSQRRMLTIMNNSTAAIAVKDAAGRYEFANPRLQNLLGVEEAALLGKTDQQIRPGPAADTARERDLQALVAGQPVEHEEVLQLADGERTLLTVRIPLASADGVVNALCIKSTDITARKRDERLLESREHHLRDLLTSLPDTALLSFDAAQRLVEAGGALAALFDAPPAPGTEAATLFAAASLAPVAALCAAQATLPAERRLEHRGAQWRVRALRGAGEAPLLLQFTRESA